MEFYSYEEVKKLKKGTHLIVLKCDDEKYGYVGLAYNKSYPMKIKDCKIQNSNFYVCTLVKSAHEDYLIIIGTSNEDEWVKQEMELQWVK